MQKASTIANTMSKGLTLVTFSRKLDLKISLNVIISYLLFLFLPA